MPKKPRPIEVCGVTVWAEGETEEELLVDENIAKWAAEHCDFDKDKLMSMCGWASTHGQLLHQLNKQIGTPVFKEFVPSADYESKYEAAKTTGKCATPVEPPADGGVLIDIKTIDSKTIAILKKLGVDDSIKWDELSEAQKKEILHALEMLRRDHESGREDDPSSYYYSGDGDEDCEYEEEEEDE